MDERQGAQQYSDSVASATMTLSSEQVSLPRATSCGRGSVRLALRSTRGSVRSRSSAHPPQRWPSSSLPALSSSRVRPASPLSSKRRARADPRPSPLALLPLVVVRRPSTSGCPLASPEARLLDHQGRQGPQPVRQVDLQPASPPRLDCHLPGLHVSSLSPLDLQWDPRLTLDSFTCSGKTVRPLVLISGATRS